MRTRLRSVAPWSRLLVVVGLSAAAPRASAQFVFESAERERVGRTPRALAIADFDEDGFPDVLCGDADDSLTLLRNDGGRGFAVAATLPLAAPSSVVTADFDEDGHADFFATSETGRDAGVGLGDGAGGFAPLAIVPLDVVPWESIAADFDRDGSVDVAVGGGPVVALLRGDGLGGFSAPEIIEIPEIDDVLALRAADLDGDGALEIVAAALPDGITGAARVVVLGRAAENTRDLEPRFVFSVPLRWPASVVSADVNGDGLEDLLFTSFIGDAPQLFAGASAGPGEFAFAEPVPVLGPNVLYAAAHDFDRDGRLDVAATGGYPGDLRLFRGDGKGSFSQEARLGTGAAPRRLEIADLDGDGRVDVATANWRDAASGTLTTFLNRTTPASRTGTVNRGAGRVVDVLFVNDSAGGAERVVRLASWESFFVFVDAPPLAERPAAFALLAWPGGAPPLDEERAMPHGIGIGGRALLEWQRGTPPAVVWNNTGLPALGRRARPSGPAPRMVVERRAGLGRPILFTLQGVIEDPGSAGDRPASVTNALTVEIR